MSEDSQNRRIFWLIETVGTESSCDYGMNFFSLYSLTFAQGDQDSAVNLSFSVLRRRTSLIANITARDSELSYESLQLAVDNLARMYNDTLELSLRAGNTEPCILPISADVTDFKLHESLTLSSFQSSLAESLQSSLICSPTNLKVTPLSDVTVPIIPKPLALPKSSTPTVGRSCEEDNEENSRIRRELENCDWVNAMRNLLCDDSDTSPSSPVGEEMIDTNTVVMKTVNNVPKLPEIQSNTATMSTIPSLQALGLLDFPTLELMDGLNSSMVSAPTVTTEDLAFVAEAEAEARMVSNTTNIASNTLAATDNGTGSASSQETDDINKYEQKQDSSSSTFIPYETLSELYADISYDTDASENEYY